MLNNLQLIKQIRNDNSILKSRTIKLKQNIAFINIKHIFPLPYQ
jgi:hypothetical protein